MTVDRSACINLIMNRLWHTDGFLMHQTCILQKLK
jgi:hypothetical protein